VAGAVTAWEPPFKKPTVVLRQTYHTGSGQVQLVIDLYRDQRVGSKLLTFISTTLSDYDADWKTFDRKLIPLSDSVPPRSVIERHLQSRNQDLLVWQWYWVGGVHTTSVWRAKLAQVMARLSGRGDAGAAVTLVAVFREDPSDARQALREFVAQMGPAIDRSLTDAVAR
jgi:EpsI family protein